MTAELDQELRDGGRVTRPFSSGRAWWHLLNHEPRLTHSVILCLPAFILAFMPIVVLSGNWPFLFEGAWAKGTVTGKAIAATRCGALPIASVLAHGGGNGSHGEVSYEFPASGGVLVQGQSGVEWSVWDQLNAGDVVDVVYQTSDPSKNRAWFGFNSGERAAMGFGGLSILLMALAATQFIRGITKVAGEVALLRDGSLVAGEILQAEATGSSRRGQVLAIRYVYEFTARDSFAAAPARRKADYTTSFGVKSPLRPGERVTVVLDAERPDRSVIDVFNLRAADDVVLRQI